MDEFNFDRSVGNYFESEFVESPKFYFAGNFSIGKNRILGPFFCACHSQHSSLGGAQALDVVTSAAVVRIAATFDRQDGEPLLRDSAVPTRGQGTGDFKTARPRRRMYATLSKSDLLRVAS